MGKDDQNYPGNDGGLQAPGPAQVTPPDGVGCHSTIAQGEPLKYAVLDRVRSST